MFRKILSIVAFIIALAAPMDVYALTNHVVMPNTPGVDPAFPFNSWSTAATNIQDALDVISIEPAYDTVLVSSGVYNVEAMIVITNPVTMRSYMDGATDRDGTIISGYAGGASNRCFYINNSAVTLDGFTISNGFAAAGDLDGHGGAIYADAAGMFTNCLFIGNTAAGFGGGVYTIDTIARVVNCEFIGNVGTSGGGMHLQRGSNIIASCVFSNNTSAIRGGGLTVDAGTAEEAYIEMSDSGFYNNNSLSDSSAFSAGGAWMQVQEGRKILSRCVFRGNTTAGVGGGLTMRRARGPLPHLIQDCIFEDNKATAASSYTSGGGGVCVRGLSGQSVIFTGCSIIDNYSRDSGGGLYSEAPMVFDRGIIAGNSCVGVGGGAALDHASAVIRNSLIVSNVGYRGGGVNFVTDGVVESCTIVSNHSSHSDFGYGGGIRTGDFSGHGQGDGTVINSIIYGNTATIDGSNWYHQVGDLIVSNSCSMPSLDAFGEGNIAVDPQFVDPGAGNYRLKPKSPCVNAGLNEDWMDDAFDLDGNPRIDSMYRRVDMGAYEYMFRGTMLRIR